jgi:hypothetical protein
LAKLNEAELKALGEYQFTLQRPMVSLWQIMANNFYPERADFTFIRNVGQEFADNLIDSFPLLVRRDLGNSLHAMLRDGDWFEMGVNTEPDYSGRVWLQDKSVALFKIMYHQGANFVRASKQGDHDYITFGQSVKSVERNKKADGLLFRNWHLRDCAWWEDENEQVCGVVRKAKPTRRNLVNYFGEDKLHPSIIKELHKKPFEEVHIRHFFMPSEYYGDEEIQSRYPYVSIYLDIANTKIIEEIGMNHKYYVVPRFQTVAGSAYAYSPATTVGLSDARCLQAMTHTLLEAAERYARPPIVATQKVVRGDIDLTGDGITWIDKDYDENTGAALRPLYQDKGGWPIGDAERTRVVETLNSAFYLNKLTLPEGNREMTATEVLERMKQFRRENLPLFAPIEAEDNGQICELAFEIAMANGFLGSPNDVPRSLRGADVEFKFESPLTVSENDEIVQRYGEVRRMLGAAVEIDPTVGHDIDLSTAIRDAITKSGSPVSWLRPEEEAAELKENARMLQMAEAAMQAQGGAV